MPIHTPHRGVWHHHILLWREMDWAGTRLYQRGHVVNPKMKYVAVVDSPAACEDDGELLRLSSFLLIGSTATSSVNTIIHQSVYNRLSLVELQQVWLGLLKHFLWTRCHSFRSTISNQVCDLHSVMEFGLKQFYLNITIAQTWSQTGSQLGFDQLSTGLQHAYDMHTQVCVQVGDLVCDLIA